MTKNEFIEKYGEEAYQRKLEQKKQYYQQNKEKKLEYQKQYNQQHREENKQYQKQYYKQYREERIEYIKQYNQQYKEKIREYKKQYYKQYREERNQYSKQYNQQHRDEINQYKKQWYRKHTCMFAFCIPEQIEQIENYELAKKDNFDGWCIHHRLETHNSDGQRRLVNLSRVELKALDMYYNRPASELVFLTKSEHTKLHRSKQRCSKE